KMSGQSQQKSPETFFRTAKVGHHKIEDATPALRIFGDGERSLIFIHGFPTHGYTWRKLIVELSKEFTCYVVDLPGMGDSEWTSETNFSFTQQAHRLSLLFNEKLGLGNYDVIAHNTGATIARMFTLANPERVGRLIAFNTEIPNHRPPWIETYQKLAALPGAVPAFRLALRSKVFIHSGAAFGQLYTDKRLLDEPTYLRPYLDPVLDSARRMEGFLSYLKGIEWNVIDEFERTHKDIEAKTLFIWGENDKTFPIGQARKMLPQFANLTELIPLDASLLPHEERPMEALQHIQRFLAR
ncbi:MAG: alpha/beta hydrolase, partial [Pseudomonadota bacterium]